MKALKLISLGLALYVIQIGGESILGFALTRIRRASDVDAAGVFLFAVVKTAYVILPFLVGFALLTYLTQNKWKPSWILLVLNIGILLWTYSSGFIEKDPWSFIVASLLTSVLIVITDNKMNFTNTINVWDKRASLQQKP